MKSIVSILACAAMLSFAAGAHAQMARPVQMFDTSAGPVKITPVYHASLEIEAGGKVIVVDPAPPAKFDGLPKGDLILITDIHGDHLNADMIKAESKADSTIIAPGAVAKTVTEAKVLGNGEKTTW